MTQQHTPGPWSVTYNVNGRPTVLGKDGANVLSDDRLSSEVVANAILEATAPELLEALEACQTVFAGFHEALNGDMTDTELASLASATIERVDTVVSKARGHGEAESEDGRGQS